MFDRLTEEGRRVMRTAREQALEAEHGTIGLAHLLLALLEEPGLVEGTSPGVLDHARKAVRSFAGRGALKGTPRQLPFSEEAHRALKRAIAAEVGPLELAEAVFAELREGESELGRLVWEQLLLPNLIEETEGT